MKRVAFDSNILAYALIDRRHQRKSSVAQTLLVTETNAAECFVSTQALNEFCSLATRKFHVAEDVLHRELELLCVLHVIVVDAPIVLSAMHRHFRSRLNFYDALIVEAAISVHAEILYSEDLQHGAEFGGLRIVNPFLGSN